MPVPPFRSDDWQVLRAIESRRTAGTISCTELPRNSGDRRHRAHSADFALRSQQRLRSVRHDFTDRVISEIGDVNVARAISRHAARPVETRVVTDLVYAAGCRRQTCNRVKCVSLVNRLGIRACC